MEAILADKIPQELKALDQWVMWKMIKKGDRPTKVPFQVGGIPASSTDKSTWTTFQSVLSAYDTGGFSGIGFVFSEDDPYCGVDLDGCRDPETGKIQPWARDIIRTFSTYTEVSPSKTGVKLFIRGKFLSETGKKKDLDEPQIVEDKSPGIEVYDHGRYFAATGLRVANGVSEVQECQKQLDSVWEKYFKEDVFIPLNRNSDPVTELTERARAYIAKLPPAVSGQSGHNATFHAACVLVKGFGLNDSQSLQILSEYNQSCQPPWSEKDLRYKIKSAAKQGGPANYLRDAHRNQWSSISVPKYKEPTPVTLTTLEAATRKYYQHVKDGIDDLIGLGLPELDEALEGGVANGEMVVFAARPSHGKSAIALQIIHHVTGCGMPSLLISEEMAELALGKRALQFVTPVPQEHWQSSTTIEKDVDDHYKDRKSCHIAEACRTIERVEEVIDEAITNNGVKVVVVDYAQLLTSPGKNRYEINTNTSVALRQMANKYGILLIILLQLSREVEKRTKFVPQMSDLKETGQWEQDADVIVFIVWPHRLDSGNDPKKYMFFVGKNRNRNIVNSVVECNFVPSRQMVVASSGQVVGVANGAEDFGGYSGKVHSEFQTTIDYGGEVYRSEDEF